MTYDQLAAYYILTDNHRALAALAKDAGYAFGSECPECGSRDTESNGSAEYRCVHCDHRWGHEYGTRYGF